MNTSKLIETLSNASSLELYEMLHIIDRLLGDPKRKAALYARLHPGKPVHFMVGRTGEMRPAIVLEVHKAHVIVQDEATRERWQITYAAIDPGHTQEPIDGHAAPPRPAQAPLKKPGRDDFHLGDKVSFVNKYLQPQIGTIVRLNQKTASVNCENEPGWRVPYSLLAHVMDI